MDFDPIEIVKQLKAEPDREIRATIMNNLSLDKRFQVHRELRNQRICDYCMQEYYVSVQQGIEKNVRWCKHDVSNIRLDKIFNKKQSDRAAENILKLEKETFRT